MRRSTILLMRGLVGIVFGVLAFVWPGLTILALIALFAAYALLDGITTLWLALTSTLSRQRQWAAVLRGMFGIAAGTFAFLWPEVSTLALLFTIGVWAVVTGVLEVVAAVMFREVLAEEWLLAVEGVMSMTFGVLLFAYPALGVVSIAWALATYATASGMLLVALGVRLRSRTRVV